MTKRERINAALNGTKTDRVPFSIYQHSTVHERTVDNFVKYTMDFQKKNDPDYLKVMFDENYDTPVNWQYIQNSDVWKELEEFDPHIGAFGRQLEALKRIRDLSDPSVPVLQTVFSPFHFSHRLTNRRMIEDWKSNPELVLNGLNTIALNIIKFAECCMTEAGVDGFFFGAFGCEKDWMSESTYSELAMPSDLKVLEELNKAEMVFLHIHGESKSFFSLLKDYPCNALSWEDKLAGPSLSEARKMTDKCLIGGIDHLNAQNCSPESIVSEGRDAITSVQAKGLILAPGCTFTPQTPQANMLALKEAVTGI
jgi:uroporphyrinogen decarboxylase